MGYLKMLGAAQLIRQVDPARQSYLYHKMENNTCACSGSGIVVVE